MGTFGTKRPAAGAKTKALNKAMAADKMEDEAMSVPMLEADITQDKKTLKAKKGLSLGKTKGPAPTMTKGTMRAPDIKKGSRFRGAY